MRPGRGSGITEFGHLCLDAPDVAEAHRFWSTTFNARASDWIGDAACLMRIDEVHHKLAVFQGDRPGLCHVNFQVAELDDVFRNWHHLQEQDVLIEMGPGRHPQSGAVFLYFLGPEGLTYEYSYGVRRITDEAAWRPRSFDPAERGVDRHVARSDAEAHHTTPGAPGGRPPMIFVTHALPVNAPGEPLITRDALWEGLVRKAENALPFVPSMTDCTVTARHSDTVFDRDIVFKGQAFSERITLEHPHRVVFTRIAGPVLGTIANEIEGAESEDGSPDDLTLRFSFALTVAGEPGGSAGEKAHADQMTDSYRAAVAATLGAVRKIAAGATV